MKSSSRCICSSFSLSLTHTSNTQLCLGYLTRITHNRNDAILKVVSLSRSLVRHLRKKCHSNRYIYIYIYIELVCVCVCVCVCAQDVPRYEECVEPFKLGMEFITLQCVCVFKCTCSSRTFLRSLLLSRTRHGWVSCLLFCRSSTVALQRLLTATHAIENQEN